MVSRLHQLLLELIAGGARRTCPPARPRHCWPRSVPATSPRRRGKDRRRVAAELISDLERIYARKKAANKELIELVAATGTGLWDLPGIGPSGAARLLVEVGDITRFPSQGTLRVLDRHRADRCLFR
jgi:transposase